MFVGVALCLALSQSQVSEMVVDAVVDANGVIHNRKGRENSLRYLRPVKNHPGLYYMPDGGAGPASTNSFGPFKSVPGEGSK